MNVLYLILVMLCSGNSAYNLNRTGWRLDSSSVSTLDTMGTRRYVDSSNCGYVFYQFDTKEKFIDWVSKNKLSSNDKVLDVKKGKWISVNQTPIIEKRKRVVEEEILTRYDIELSNTPAWKLIEFHGINPDTITFYSIKRNNQ